MMDTPSRGCAIHVLANLVMVVRPDLLLVVVERTHDIERLFHGLVGEGEELLGEERQPCEDGHDPARTRPAVERGPELSSESIALTFRVGAAVPIRARDVTGARAFPQGSAAIERTTRGKSTVPCRDRRLAQHASSSGRAKSVT